MSKRTPGEWKVGSESFNKKLVISQTGVVVADCSTANRGGGDDEEKLANARLIAAAPEMLAALERLVFEYGVAMKPSLWVLVQNAVEKAEGLTDAE